MKNIASPINTAYKSFKYNVRYEIYKERGKNTAKASWEMLNIGAQEFAN